MESLLLKGAVLVSCAFMGVLEYSFEDDFSEEWDQFVTAGLTESNSSCSTVRGQVIFKRACGKYLCFVFIQEFIRKADQALIDLF